MARWLKQSTSVDLPIGPFVDATDGITAETGLTLTQPDIRLKKNGGAWAQKAAAQTLTHEENGFYEVTLDATDTDTLGQLFLAVFESGAVPVWHEFQVVPANVWDSLFGADLLQVDSTQLLGTAYATPTVAGVQEVDLTHVSGSAMNTATAQIGVNVVQVKTQTVPDPGVTGRFLVDLSHIKGGLVPDPAITGTPDVNVTAIADAADPATRLGESAQGIVTFIIGSGSTTTSIVFGTLSPASAVNDQYNGRIITFSQDTTTTALRGQSTDITDYVHATLTASATALTNAPVSGDTGIIT